MATYQKVKFTGDRTGLERIRLPRYGTISAGDEVLIEVSQAEAWTAELPTRELDEDGQQVLKSDFEAVGSAQELDRREYNRAVQEARQDAADRKAKDDGDDDEDDRTHAQLDVELEAAGLPTTGNRAEKIERLAGGSGEGLTAEEEAAKADAERAAANEAGDGEGNEA